MTSLGPVCFMLSMPDVGTLHPHGIQISPEMPFLVSFGYKGPKFSLAIHNGLNLDPNSLGYGSNCGP